MDWVFYLLPILTFIAALSEVLTREVGRNTDLEAVKMFKEDIKATPPTSQIMIRCGKGSPRVYRKVIRKLREAKKRGIEIRVIANKDYDLKTPLLQLHKEGVLEMRYIDDLSDLGHFRVCGARLYREFGHQDIMRPYKRYKFPTFTSFRHYRGRISEFERLWASSYEVIH